MTPAIPGPIVRCTGHCIFDGDVLGPEDLACPVHGLYAQEKAHGAGWKYLSWMKAARLAYPYAPSGAPVDYFPELGEHREDQPVPA